MPYDRDRQRGNINPPVRKCTSVPEGLIIVGCLIIFCDGVFRDTFHKGAVGGVDVGSDSSAVVVTGSYVPVFINGNRVGTGGRPGFDGGPCAALGSTLEFHGQVHDVGINPRGDAAVTGGATGRGDLKAGGEIADALVAGLDGGLCRGSGGEGKGKHTECKKYGQNTGESFECFFHDFCVPPEQILFEKEFLLKKGTQNTKNSNLLCADKCKFFCVGKNGSSIHSCGGYQNESVL